MDLVGLIYIFSIITKEELVGLWGGVWDAGVRRGGRGVMEVQCSCIKLTQNPFLKKVLAMASTRERTTFSCSESKDKQSCGLPQLWPCEGYWSLLGTQTLSQSELATWNQSSLCSVHRGERPKEKEYNNKNNTHLLIVKQTCWNHMSLMFPSYGSYVLSFYTLRFWQCSH